MRSLRTRPERLIAPSLSAVLGTALLLGACGGSDTTPGLPAAAVRDSAGITLVENPAPPSGSRLPWTVAPAPSVDIGALEGEAAYQLYQAQDALRLDDGRILVANAGGGEIRVFDDRGGHLATWGRQGEGPGEYMAPTALSLWPGSDSLAVWDRRAQRLTVLTSDGTLGRTVTLPARENMQSVNFVAALPRGDLVVSGLQFRMESQGLSRLPTTFAIVSREGDFRTELGTSPGAETMIQASDNRVAITQVPFGRTTVAAVLGDETIIAPNERFELPFRDPGGALRRIVRVGITPTPLTPEIWSAEVERRVADAPEQAQPGLRSSLEGLPERPETLPVFDRILADPTGHLWVRLFRTPADAHLAHRWLVLDTSGQVLGWMETPAPLDVYRIGPDHLLGRSRDDLDVEHIQVWRLER